MKIGILSVQGNFEAHAKILECLGVPYRYVNQPKHLSGIKGLILPGGESTTMLKFLLEDNFFEAIKEFARTDGCLLGTCAGAILMAKQVLNPEQISLNLVDVTIERNAYGRQLASHIGKGDYCDGKENMEMIFIRAPRIIQVGQYVNVFAAYQGQPVGVKQENWMLTTFHPELTRDNTIHQMFIKQCCIYSAQL